jgi:putative heme-binding domain-containing protein
LIHTTHRPGSVRGIALSCLEHFPNADWRVNRELAIVLTHFRREKKILDEPVHAKLLEALLKAKDDRQQQIHYFYCLRLLHDGWTPEQKSQLLAWFDTTKTWSGGHSFMPFLDNILRELSPIFTSEERDRLIAEGDKRPRIAIVLMMSTPDGQRLDPRRLVAIYERVLKDNPGQGPELREALLDTLDRVRDRETQASLRRIADLDPSQRNNIARRLARAPAAPENFPYLVNGLAATQPETLLLIIDALKRNRQKPAIPMEPTAGDAAPFRLLLLASSRLEVKDRMKAVELLRHWKNQKFAVDPGDWKGELDGWSRWFAQTFPKEAALPNVTEVAVQSKWRFEELIAFLNGNPAGQGDAARGKAIFEKANCLKCHKFGSIGEGLGPDLTTLKSRFKRADTLEALIYPSKVISDQYRGTKILTKDGATITGLAAAQGNLITILQLDGTKVTLKEEDIDVRVASTVSPMPEKLLDELTKEQIADLFAYMESEPPK